jgi:MoaA/NifB/PqqE/SkfB family radical SAM enzyme
MTTRVDPRRYFEVAPETRDEIAPALPVCVYFEVTNRCNLLCETCPRTFEELERPADMAWALFTRIVEQVPNLARAVMHGVGEPMLVRELPAMIRHLKARGVYVLFNTNGTVLSEAKGRTLAKAGLDELRISLDAADRASFAAIRGRDMFDRILANIVRFRRLQRAEGLAAPRLSLWLTGLKETLPQLADFVRLAHRLDVPEVHLQRLVFLPEGIGRFAVPDQALFENLTRDEARLIADAERVAAELGVAFSASGATEPGTSVTRQADRRPWSLCRRPWTVTYVTATGRVMPCCFAPFTVKGYDSATLGDAAGAPLAEIWNGPAYRDFRRRLMSDDPHPACSGCGLRWSL